MKQGRARILVVEDNELNLELVRDLLEVEGFEVAVAVDGADALHVAESETFDLILMDIQLPGMDGLEVTRRLRANGKLDRTPIVALTAHAMVGEAERALAEGCNGYITKPIEIASFLAEIESHLPAGAEGQV